ncbi:hypothetical protein N431DRAFT_442697 [Stipitochalara longipes BDJ]|nr:hypothetical protein N431DRAFT_442697 [Stipitochalara longipes BDJ]
MMESSDISTSKTSLLASDAWDNSEDLDNIHDAVLQLQQPSRKRFSSVLLIFLSHGLVSVIVALFFIYARQCPLSECLTRLNTYSFEAIELEVVRINGSIGLESIYKGTPSPALDEAWNYIMTEGVTLPNGNLVSVGADVLERIGKPQDPAKIRPGLGTAASYPPEVGEYMVILEVFHQLHCLNLLRRWNYKEYYGDDPEAPQNQRLHRDHCIDILRQHIMCNVDVGLVTTGWVKKPFSEGARLWDDFSTVHVCRNFETIREWYIAHNVLGRVTLKDTDIVPSVPPL